MQTAAPAAPTQSWHRLQHPESGLYVRLTCRIGARGKPLVTARLAPRAKASRFTTWDAAAEILGVYLPGQPLEIERSDQ